jgi:hypothetical protein
MARKSKVKRKSRGQDSLREWCKEMNKPLIRVSDEHAGPGISPVDRLRGILKKAVVIRRGH